MIHNALIKHLTNVPISIRLVEIKTFILTIPINLGITNINIIKIITNASVKNINNL